MSANPKLREFFVPFSEAMVAETGFDMGPLVPFKLEYDCVHTVISESGSEPEIALTDLE
ncbi:MAG: hypothetical protein QF921_04745 [Pseudomonadales bacterium]|jgi:hypothetical protein|nr:hypothetical protein [Pseudomonadales bacterium]MDP6472984.1 hypothetical protein [Pseudomonadales bacterium]MDP6826260.1 hypothetical protein [Pseudomonadales bacterium]MDP6970810.1 hypothetical protein [Pseudomonadales bacterium]|tara:strand:+ start:11877 stop:12053 length:177 start_codon:yes stop_codon:yes gene_type:complete